MKIDSRMTNNSKKHIAFRFGVRFLLLTTAVICAYISGWMSHREWNKSNVDSVVSEAISRIHITGSDGTKYIDLGDVEGDARRVRDAATE